MVSATGSIHFSLGKVQTRRANRASAVIKGDLDCAYFAYVAGNSKGNAHQKRTACSLILEKRAKLRGEVRGQGRNRSPVAVEERERHCADGISIVEAGKDYVELVGAASHSGSSNSDGRRQRCQGGG